MRNNLRHLIGVVILTLSAGATVSAQTSPEPPFTLPRLMLSLGVGQADDPEGAVTNAPLQTLSAQWFIDRHVITEAEVTHWAVDWNHRTSSYYDLGSRRTWSVGGNLMYRSEPRRVSWFTGIGAFFAVKDETRSTGSSNCLTCTPFPVERRRDHVALQGVVGTDVGITGPVRAYVTLQVTSMANAYIRTSAGVRMVTLTTLAEPEAQRRARMLRQALLSSSAPASMAANATPGQNVRVSFTNGKRLNAGFGQITDTELVVRKGGNFLRYPLAQVLLVETLHHTARKAAIAGALMGFFAGAMLAAEGSDSDDYWFLGGLLFSGIGAASSALAGAAIDFANSPKHVVYVAPGPTVTLTPDVTPKKAAVGLALRW